MARITKNTLKALTEITTEKGTNMVVRFEYDSSERICTATVYSEFFSYAFSFEADQECIKESSVTYQFESLKKYLKTCKSRNYLVLEKEKIKEYDNEDNIKSESTNLFISGEDEETQEPVAEIQIKNFDFSTLKMLSSFTGNIPLLPESKDVLLEIKKHCLSFSVTNGYSICMVEVPCTSDQDVIGRKFLISSVYLKNIGKILENTDESTLYLSKSGEKFGLFLINDAAIYCQVFPVSSSFFDKICYEPMETVDLKKTELNKEFVKSFASYRKSEKSMEKHQVNLMIQDGKVKIIGTEKEYPYPMLPVPVMVNAYDYNEISKYGIMHFSFSDDMFSFEGKHVKLLGKRKESEDAAV